MPVNPHNTADRTPHRNSVLRELRDMQLVAMQLINNPDTKPSDVAQLMRAHVAAEQQRNILRMRPAPKPIDVSGLGGKRGRARRARSEAGITPMPAPAQVQEPGQPGQPSSKPETQAKPAA